MPNRVRTGNLLRQKLVSEEVYSLGPARSQIRKRCASLSFADFAVAQHFFAGAAYPWSESAKIVLVPVRFCPIDGCYVWSGVELVWHAEATYSRNRRPALFYCDESTITSAAFVATTVLSAPFIGLSCSDTDSEEPRYS